MSRDREFDAVELCDGRALRDTLLIGLRRIAAGEETAAIRGDRGPGKLRIGRQRLRIGDGAIEGDPISLGYL